MSSNRRIYEVGDEAHPEDIAPHFPSGSDAKLLVSRLSIDDGAFILRSNGTWCYAIVVDASPSMLTFKVNKNGCIKKVGLGHWHDRVKTLKQSRVLGEEGVEKKAGGGSRCPEKVDSKSPWSRKSGEHFPKINPTITNILKCRYENIGCAGLVEIATTTNRQIYSKKSSSVTRPPIDSQKKNSQDNNVVKIIDDDGDDISMNEAEEDELIRRVCSQQQGGQPVQPMQECRMTRKNKRQSISQVISSVFKRQVSLDDPQNNDVPKENLSRSSGKGRIYKRQSITQTIASIFNPNASGNIVEGDEGEKEEVLVRRPTLLDAQDMTHNGSIFNPYESGNTFASIEVLHGAEDQADEKCATEDDGITGFSQDVGKWKGKSGRTNKRQSISQAIVAIFIPVKRNETFHEESNCCKVEQQGISNNTRSNKKYQEYETSIPPNHANSKGGPTRARRQSFTSTAAASFLRGIEASRIRNGNSEYSPASCVQQHSHHRQQRDRQSGAPSITPRTTSDIFNDLMMLDSKKNGLFDSPSRHLERGASPVIESQHSGFSHHIVDQDVSTPSSDAIPIIYKSKDADVHEQQRHSHQQGQQPERKKRTMSTLFKTIMTDERKPNSRRRLCDLPTSHDISQSNTSKSSSIKRANSKSPSAATPETQVSSRRSALTNMDKNLTASATFRKAVSKIVTEGVVIDS